MTNKFRLGDEVVINNPSSRFHKYRGKIIGITHYASGLNWAIVDVNINGKVVLAGNKVHKVISIQSLHSHRQLLKRCDIERVQGETILSLE